MLGLGEARGPKPSLQECILCQPSFSYDSLGRLSCSRALAPKVHT